MQPIRILIVEDDPEWQDILREELQKLAPRIELEIAADSIRAESLLKDSLFDLITVDLDLWGFQENSPVALRSTIELLKRIRQAGPNRFTAMVIVTGHPEPSNFSEILTLQLAQDFFPKGNGLISATFLGSIREALLVARIARVEAESAEGITLTLRTSEREWLGCALSGARTADQDFERPLPFMSKTLAEQSDRIGEIFAAEVALLATPSAPELGRLWRSSAKELGIRLHEEFMRQPTIAQYLTGASVQVPDHHLLLRFLSPATSLGVPFELLHDGEDFLCQKHPVTRRVAGLGADLRRPNQPLQALLRQIKKDGKAFRLLIVAAQLNEAPLPSISTEVEMVEELTRTELENHFGLRLDATVLTDTSANFGGAREAISKGAHFVHYAGHGLFDEKLPERSGIVLHQAGKPKVFSAVDLKGLVSGSSLRFCFFNCCLSARTAAGPDRGDFVGLAQALLAGGVPTVLGHRWEVLDKSSVEFARAFYTNLWRTFRFEDAVLAARQAAAQGDLGRDDPIWASPVLIDQPG